MAVYLGCPHCACACSHQRSAGKGADEGPGEKFQRSLISNRIGKLQVRRIAGWICGDERDSRVESFRVTFARISSGRGEHSHALLRSLLSAFVHVLERRVFGICWMLRAAFGGM